MQKTVLNDVFELLQQIGAVNSESEFSRDWLARSECYMRTLRFKQANPSVGTLAMCKQTSALRTLYDGYRASRTACQTVHWTQRTVSQADKCWCCGVVERRGESLTSNTVTSNEQSRHPKLGFKHQNFVQRILVVKYLQKWGGDFYPPQSASC